MKNKAARTAGAYQEDETLDETELAASEVDRPKEKIKAVKQVTNEQAADAFSDDNVFNEEEMDGDNGSRKCKLFFEFFSQYAIGILSSTTFSTLEGKVSNLTLNAIKEMGFENMMEFQAKSIPHLLEGRDLFGKAKKGSGKTLAFLIPAIERVCNQSFMPQNGTAVIIISPTIGLAMETFDVLLWLSQHHSHTCFLVTVGVDPQAQATKLLKGVDILVATPGRLLYHLENTRDFLLTNLQCLIIDDGDRILDIGFEEDIEQIIRILPKKRQTMLFSATSSQKTEDLAKLVLKKDPIYVGPKMWQSHC